MIIPPRSELLILQSTALLFTAFWAVNSNTFLWVAKAAPHHHFISLQSFFQIYLRLPVVLTASGFCLKSCARAPVYHRKRPPYLFNTAVFHAIISLSRVPGLCFSSEKPLTKALLPKDPHTQSAFHCRISAHPVSSPGKPGLTASRQKLSWKVLEITSACCSGVSLMKFTAYPETRIVS